MTPILSQKRLDILRIAAKHGVKDVRIFGSAARGDAGPSSDIDLLVKMDVGRSLLDLVGFGQDVEDLLGCKVDVVTEGGISPYLANKILSEAVPL